MGLPKILVVAFILGCCGCSKTVLVSDTANKPIQGAVVIPVSLSMSGPGVTTDGNGQAQIPSQVGPQRIQWVSVNKQGFQPAYVAVPATWPLRITLAPATATAPTTHR
jgi:hypothetical protein